MCDCPKMDPTWLHRSSTGSSQVERLLRKLKTQKETSLRRHRYSKPLNILNLLLFKMMEIIQADKLVNLMDLGNNRSI